MKKAAIIFLLFSASCFPRRDDGPAFTPVSFDEVCDLVDKPDVSHFVEVEGYLGTPGFIHAINGADDFNFYATQEDTVALEVMITVANSGTSCIILPGFEYTTDDLKISLEDSTIIGFREKIKLRGQVLDNKSAADGNTKPCLISVQEIVKAGN